MQRPYTNTIELDVLNKYVEVPCIEMTKARCLVKLSQGSSWGTAVIQFYGSPSDKGSTFVLLPGSPPSMTADESMSDEFNVGSLRRLRAKVTTVGPAGAVVEVQLCLSNPAVLAPTVIPNPAVLR